MDKGGGASRCMHTRVHGRFYARQPSFPRGVNPQSREGALRTGVALSDVNFHEANKAC